VRDVRVAYRWNVNRPNVVDGGAFAVDAFTRGRGGLAHVDGFLEGNVARKAKGRTPRRYGKKAAETIEKVMRERKRGTLRSSSGAKVTSRRQAIAIGLSEARQAGGKVPPMKKRKTAAKNG
jgi:hypothetical protein